MAVFYYTEAAHAVMLAHLRLWRVKGKTRLITRAEPALLNKRLVSFKGAYSMVYWLENVYILASIRSCQFSQGDIYWPHGICSQRWGSDDPGGDSQGFHGANPPSVTYARPGGILFEISPARLA